LPEGGGSGGVELNNPFKYEVSEKLGAALDVTGESMQAHV